MTAKFLRAVALLILLAATPALGQTLSSPPDVGTYVAQPVTYATGTDLNVVGDGSDTAGGVAPYFTSFPEPADGYTVPAGYISSEATSYCLTTNGNPVGACNNKKVRFVSNPIRYVYDDPIRYWGQPGVSHCHEVFGNGNFNAYTTRASIEARPSSANAGGPANATPYWIPCMEKTIGGKLYAVGGMIDVIYYNEEVPEGTPLVNRNQKLHPLLRFIGGTNTADPNDCRSKNEIDIANGGAGTSCTITPGRYAYIGNGFKQTANDQGYACVLANGSITPTNTGASYTTKLVNADGSDPWLVSGTHTCVDGSVIEQSLAGPECTDGHNVSSPTGYDHVRYAINDSQIGRPVCPMHWYFMPILQEKFQRPTRGWTDYSTWVLASDAMVAAKCTALGQTCDTGVGWSMHLDWMNGWPVAIRNKWHAFCLGIPVPGNTNPAPHGCDYSTISATERLISDSPSPDGKRDPQVSNVWYDTNNAANLKLIDTNRTSTHNMKGM